MRIWRLHTTTQAIYIRFVDWRVWCSIWCFCNCEQKVSLSNTHTSTGKFKTNTLDVRLSPRYSLALSSFLLLFLFCDYYCSVCDGCDAYSPNAFENVHIVANVFRNVTNGEFGVKFTTRNPVYCWIQLRTQSTILAFDRSAYLCNVD